MVGVVVAATGPVKEPTARVADLRLTRVLRALVTDPVQVLVVVAAQIQVVVEVAWPFPLTLADLEVRVWLL